jgi:hypothetical protein
MQPAMEIWFQHQYWTRLWIVLQELVLAREVVLLNGMESVECRSSVLPIHFLSWLTMTGMLYISANYCIIRDMNLALILLNNSSRGYVHWGVHFPQDRIFALIEILKSDEASLL